MGNNLEPTITADRAAVVERLRDLGFDAENYDRGDGILGVSVVTEGGQQMFTTIDGEGVSDWTVVELSDSNGSLIGSATCMARPHNGRGGHDADTPEVVAQALAKMARALR